MLKNYYQRVRLMLPGPIGLILKIVFFSLLGVSCMGKDGGVLLSYLVNNRMTIVLKGTYASDDPLEWEEINDNRLFVDSDDDLGSLRHAEDGCTPFTTRDCLPTYNSLPIYIDFRGVRLSSKSSDPAGIRNSEDSENFWDIASDERRVYCNQLYGSNNSVNSCLDANGLENFAALMDGSGVVYPSRDVSNSNYIQSGVYVRRILTGWAYEDDELIDNALFDNFRVVGRDIFLEVGIPPPPTDPNAEDNPGPSQWFPLHYRSGAGQSLNKGTGYLPVVLEIRFNIKENLMVHSHTLSGNNDIPVTTTLIAFSDWKLNHLNDGSDESHRMGGNVLSHARFFYPHYVSRLDIRNGTAGSNRHYYALYQSGETDRDNSLPYAATPARSGINELNHIMPGSYQLECYWDSDGQRDGYPEMRVGTPMNIEISVPQNPGIISVDYDCG